MIIESLNHIYLVMVLEQLKIVVQYLIRSLLILLSRVGLIASEAKLQGYDILENKVFVSNIPRHKINNDSRGLFKAVINKDTKEILGASLYGKESEELISLIKLAIDQHIPYTVLRDNIYTHPTMTESFNDLVLEPL